MRDRAGNPLMTSSHHNLDNLVVIVDNNSFQQTGKNKDIKNILNLKKKFSSFWLFENL